MLRKISSENSWIGVISQTVYNKKLDKIDEDLDNKKSNLNKNRLKAKNDFPLLTLSCLPLKPSVFGPISQVRLWVSLPESCLVLSVH
jgi:hypothetical protein